MMKKLLLLILLLAPPAWADFTTNRIALGACEFYALNETSGTTATAGTSSGTGCLGSIAGNGTYRGGPTFSAPGPIKYTQLTGTTFDGINDDVLLNTGADAWVIRDASANKEFTVEAWFKTAATLAYTLLGQSRLAVNQEWYIQTNTDASIGLNVEQNLCSVTPFYASTFSAAGAFSTTDWNQVAVTTKLNGSGNGLAHVNVYVNGSLAASATSFTGSMCTTTASTAVTLGQWGMGNTYFAGSLSAVSFYGYELTAGQVQANYRIATGRQPRRRR